MKTVIDTFESKYEEYLKQTETFSQYIFRLMQTKKWNVGTFTRNTYETDRTYYRIKENKFNTPHTKKILSICIGLKLNYQQREYALHLAGRNLTSSREDFAYTYILDTHNCETLTVPQFNKAYLTLGMPPNGLIGTDKE